MTLDRAQSIAAKVVERLAPFCAQIQIAGSIRRQRPECKDIDLVLLPHDAAARVEIERVIAERCRIEQSGEENLVAIMADKAETKLDLWIARGPLDISDLFHVAKRPANFGSLLLCRTGSISFNIQLVDFAKRRGMRWHPHDGLIKAGEYIAAETEEQIFDALDLTWLEPERREPGVYLPLLLK